MKILYLAHRIPYPPNKGDKIRSFNEIKYLSNSHEIDLVCLADNPGDVRFQEDLKKYCKKVIVLPFNRTWAKLRGLAYLLTSKAISVGYFYWKKVQQTVDHWLEQTDYEAIICFSSPMAEYVFRSKHVWTGRAQVKDLNPEHYAQRPKPLLIMDFCDLDSDKWGQYAKLSTFPKSFIYRLENRSLSVYERKIAEAFDHSVFVSQKELEIFKNQNPHLTNVSVIPNGVDYKYFAPQKRRKAGSAWHKEASHKALHPVLLFTGAMDYHANVDGVTWFCEKIFPGIKASLPETQFYIIGSSPTQGVRNLGNGDDISVTGFVEDTRPFYEKADICVIPLRLARGVQNKVLEAMSMEKAVVSTPQAVQGITAVNGEHLAIADEPNEFVQAVVILIKETDRRRALGRNARRFVITNYDWQVNMNILEQLLMTI